MKEEIKKLIRKYEFELNNKGPGEKFSSISDVIEDLEEIIEYPETNILCQCITHDKCPDCGGYR